MARRVQLRSLVSERFLRELHHFLWIEPSLSGKVLDAGWNCRDHAWLTALMVQSLGHKPLLFHGEAFFVKGANGKSGSVSYTQQPHSWIAVEGVGAVDLSVKPEFSISGDDFRIPVTCIFANECLPRGRSTAYFFDDPGVFAQAVRELPNRRNQASAVYLKHEAEHLHDGHLARAAGWIGSPLTQRLDSRYGNPSDLYAALLLHIRSFLVGSVPSLAGLPFDEAWGQLAARRAGAIDRARACIEDAEGFSVSPSAQADAIG